MITVPHAVLKVEHVNAGHNALVAGYTRRVKVVRIQNVLRIKRFSMYKILLILLVGLLSGCASVQKAWVYTGTKSFPQHMSAAEKIITIIEVQDPDIIEGTEIYGGQENIEAKIAVAGLANHYLLEWGSKGAKKHHWAIKWMNRIYGFGLLVLAGFNTSYVF